MHNNVDIMEGIIEVRQEAIASALQFYEDELFSAKFYGGTSEGNVHRLRSDALRGMGLRLGVFSDEMIAGAVKRVEAKVKKTIVK